jgi:N-methylhydantoinase A
MTAGGARLAVDIGGTFTDIAMERGARRWSAKVLTTPQAPELGVMNAVEAILAKSGVAAADVDILIHGTTLATNAIIERKGARTALLVTAGFRDAVEMAFENRFEQYDIYMDKPAPLVPRALRLPVPERIEARGKVVTPLDEAALLALVPTLRAAKVESVAIGFLHSYVNPAHEQRAGAVLAAAMPELSVTLSSEVSPEMREYERWSTACANAYVRPVMDRYLARLQELLKGRGLACPVFLITSAGSLTTVETARRLPIRLVESGPAGGAILAAWLARECGLDRVVSFDMGGTTAKICLIDDGLPQYSRTFEVARQYRFMKGSGLPLRIPVIEMVEIGAGGGSIASVDAMRRIQVGPESAGSEPGPACYARGGSRPTVTDADVALGRIDPARFAGGTITLAPAAARQAIETHVAVPLGLDGSAGAIGISEVVEENMANAARVHAVERGKELSNRTMIAFGGAAPLHAARLAEKLGIRRMIVPSGAGVGSAIGFLLAPVAYETVRSRYVRIDASLDSAALEALRDEMRREATAVVRQGAPTAPLVESWTADMRYVGQGHEISVSFGAAPLTASAVKDLHALFEAEYARTFGRTIPGHEIEALTWALRLAAAQDDPAMAPAPPPDQPAKASGSTSLTDPASGRATTVPVYWRPDLAPGAAMPGPCIIAEEETSTLVTPGFTARITALGYIELAKP